MRGYQEQKEKVNLNTSGKPVSGYPDRDFFPLYPALRQQNDVGGRTEAGRSSNAAAPH